MAPEAPPADWPPAAKRWTRTNEIELEIYAPGTQMVELTQDPALNPQQNGFVIKQAVVRRKGGQPQLTIRFDNTNRLPVDISFKVNAQVGGQKFSGGGLNIHSQGDSQSLSGLEQTFKIAELSRDTDTADIILTPDPAQVESNAAFKRIWGGQLEFQGVPLKRLDLPAAAPDLCFGPVVERIIEPGNPARRALNFALGKFIEPGPARALDFSETGTNSLRAAGVDLYAGDNELTPEMLSTLDLRLCVGINPPAGEIQNMNLDQLTPEKLQVVLDEMENWRANMETVRIAGLDLRRATGNISGSNLYLFITRNDIKGVLQITGVTENPRGVKIRYKLLPAGDQ
jgi:hypothetical protein